MLLNESDTYEMCIRDRFRELILVLIFACLLGLVFNMGEIGVYIGMLIGGLIGSVIAYGIIEIYVKRLIMRNQNGN